MFVVVRALFAAVAKQAKCAIKFQQCVRVWIVRPFAMAANTQKPFHPARPKQIRRNINGRRVCAHFVKTITDADYTSN